MNFFKRMLNRELPSLLAFPALIWQALFLYLPLTVLIFYSFIKYSSVDGKYCFTFSFYSKVLSFSYLTVVFNSFLLAFVTTVICLVIAYPVAYFIALKVAKKYRTVFLLTLILPSWTNLIVQIYAWFFLLEKNSLLSKFLYFLGLFDQPPHMLNNYFSIVVGTVYCFLPFMILPIYSVLEKMDKNLLEASADLGADHWQTFKRITFMLSAPGVISGCFLVFIPVFGEFAIPTLLGGGKQVFWGNVIVEKFLIYKDWKGGAAFSNLGIVFSLFLILFFFVVYKFVSFILNRRFYKETFNVKERYNWSNSGRK